MKNNPNLNEEKAIGNDISSQRILSRMIERFVIVWLDSNIDESDRNYQNIIIQFQRIVDRIKTFANPDQCLDFLITIKDLNSIQFTYFVRRKFNGKIISNNGQRSK